MASSFDGLTGEEIFGSAWIKCAKNGSCRSTCSFSIGGHRNLGLGSASELLIHFNASPTLDANLAALLVRKEAALRAVSRFDLAALSR